MATKDIPVDRLYNFYKLLLEKSCLCRTVDDFCLERLNVFQDWLEMGVVVGDADSSTREQPKILRNDEDKARIEYSESWKTRRERILLCLTVGQELFEAKHCKRLRGLQQKIVSSGMVLEAMHRFMAAEDRLVAFSACKMTVAVLSSCLLEEDTVATFLLHRLQISLSTIKTIVQNTGDQESVSPEIGEQSQTISNQVNPDPTHISQIGCSQCSHHCEENTHPGQGNGRQVVEKLKSEYTSPREVSPGQVNQAVFTFDLCKLLLIRIGQKHLKDKEKRDLMLGGQSCTIDSLMPTEDRSSRLGDIQAQLVSILNDILPELVKAFTVPAKVSRYTRSAAGSDGCHSSVLLILASLLDLLHSLLKLKTSEQYSQIFASLGTPFMDLLREYCGDIISLKKNLDIFVLIMNHSSDLVPSGQLKSCDGASANDNNDLITMATIFVDMVSKGNILRNISYRNGPVGFGGSCFQSAGCCDMNQEVKLGDRSLLRKFCQATLSAIRVLLNCHSPRRNFDETGLVMCLQVLSQYVCAKLNLDVDSAVHAWLFECFADQDDILVWAMHCTLDLHKATASRKLPSAILYHWLNPHVIFRGFLDTVGYDPSLLLDLLISSETPFLEYLVQYLHTIIQDWDSFQNTHQTLSFEKAKLNSQEPPGDVNDKTIKNDIISKKVLEDCENESPRSKRRKSGLLTNEPGSLQDVGHSSSSNRHACSRDSDIQEVLLVNNSGQNSLDDVMTTLIRLRFSIERINNSKLFPYPVGPLLRLLERVENLYEAVG